MNTPASNIKGSSEIAQSDLLTVDVPKTPQLELSPPYSLRQNILEVGQVIESRFRIMDLLGQGGIGTVFKAHDNHLGRPVAVKMMHSYLNALNGECPSSDNEIRFHREAEIMAHFNHPNILQVYDFKPREGGNILVTEYVEGKDMRRWTQEHSPQWQELWSVYKQAAQGLHALHEAGFIHRDFKPSNVMIGVNGEVKLIDFGLARAIHVKNSDESFSSSDLDLFVDPSASSSFTRITKEGEWTGTPSYASPEQLHAFKLDRYSDQFSFCVALWEAFYGQRPFGKEDLDNLLSWEGGPLEANIDASPVPKGVVDVLKKGLSGDPSDRYNSMQDLIEAMEKAIKEGEAIHDEGRPEKVVAISDLRN